MNKKNQIGLIITRNSLIFIFLPTVIISIITIIILVSESRSRAVDSLNSTILFFMDDMNSMIEECDNIYALTANNFDVQKMLREVYDNQSDWIRQRMQIDNILMQEWRVNTRYADSLYLLIDDGRYFKSTNFPFIRTNFEETSWYQKLNDGNDAVWDGPNKYSLVSNNRKENYIVSSYPFYNVKTGKRSGVFLVEIMIDQIMPMFSNAPSLDSLFIEIYDSSGNIIIQTGQETNHEEKSFENIGFLQLSVSGNLQNGWSMKLCCSLFDVVGDSILKSLGSIILAVLLISIIAIYYSRRLAHEISDPISNLLQFMINANDLNNVTGLVIQTNIYEIEALVSEFNKMLSRINSLFEELETKQTAVRTAQYAALQAQINPHFLYNTLDNISWQIRSENYEQALKSLMAFSRYFRLSLSKGADLIPVEDELHHAELYLEIQQTRYGDRMNYEIIDMLRRDDLQNTFVPKLILQPLIENAIYHGLQTTKNGGTIIVTLDKDQSGIILSVKDNGSGISEEQLDTINQNLNDPEYGQKLSLSDGYGIYNINLRIKSVFGDAYGLKIFSVLGESTTSILYLPVRNRKDLDAKSIDLLLS